MTDVPKRENSASAQEPLFNKLYGLALSVKDGVFV